MTKADGSVVTVKIDSSFNVTETIDGMALTPFPCSRLRCACVADRQRMRIGVVFPQTEMGADPGAIRAYALGVAALGYEHILAYDHVVGADPVVHNPWHGPYDVDTTFHEPFVLFGYLAASTTLELVTGIIILPQRQTALVAKQAAEVDLFTGGRFRLGVGLGWNAVEYEALGADFSNRGRRSEEQIELLRELWTKRSVTHAGEYEKVTAAGLAPRPVQRPIPIWIGAASATGVPARAVSLPTVGFRCFRRVPRSTTPHGDRREAAERSGSRRLGALGLEGAVRWSPDGGLDPRRRPRRTVARPGVRPTVQSTR